MKARNGRNGPLCRLFPAFYFQAVACENGGDYAYIPALGAVRSKTQKYLDTLSLPMTQSDDDANRARWTTAYPDAITGQSTISAAVPVFRDNKTSGEKTFQGIPSLRTKLTGFVIFSGDTLTKGRFDPMTP